MDSVCCGRCYWQIYLNIRFQFGPRYAAATGETLLDGYKKLGKGVLLASYIVSFMTMFIIQAAVTIVTAGLAVRSLD